MILDIPALVMTVLSSAIMTSGGSMVTTGTLARAGGVTFLLSSLSGFIGMLVFTMQQVSCLTNCPAEGFFYYPRMEQNQVQFAWSFYITWAGQCLSFVLTVLLFIISCIAQNNLEPKQKNNEHVYGNAN